MESQVLTLIFKLLFLASVVSIASAVITISDLGTDGNHTIALDENVPTDTLIATIDAADSEDNAATFTIAITNNPDPAKWKIVSNNQIQTAVASAFDYETATTAEIIYTVTSTGGSPAITRYLTITVNDVDDNAPSFNPTAYSFSVEDGAGASTVVGTVTASDADGTDAHNTITFSIESGNTGAIFAVDGSTGVITVAASKTASFSTQSAFALTVRASSSSLNTDQTVFVGVCKKSSASAMSGSLGLSLAVVYMIIRNM